MQARTTTTMTTPTESLLNTPTRLGAALAVAALVAVAWLGASQVSHDKVVAATAQPARVMTAVVLPRVEVVGTRERQVAVVLPRVEVTGYREHQVAGSAAAGRNAL